MKTDVMYLRKLAVEELESRKLLAVTLPDSILTALHDAEVAPLYNATENPITPIDLSSLNEDNNSDVAQTITVDNKSEALEFSAAEFDDNGNEIPTLVVTTLEDSVNPTDGEISLREAIEIYSSSVGGETPTVTFASGLKGTITLMCGQITIDHAVNIVASSKGITIDANKQSRIFYISDAVTLEGLTITRGHATEESGGAILIENGSLTARKTSFTHNIAGHRGGAIYSTGSNLTIENTSFLSNQANVGGALWISDGVTNLESVLIAENASTSSSGASAISYTASDQVNDTIKVVNATIANNIGNHVMTFDNALYDSENNVKRIIFNSIIVNNRIDLSETVSVDVFIDTFGGRTSGFLKNSLVTGTTTYTRYFADQLNILTDNYRINVSGLNETQRGYLVDYGKDDEVSVSTDLAGKPRKVDGNGDGIVKVDAGAYEVQLEGDDPEPTLPPDGLSVSWSQQISEGGLLPQGNVTLSWNEVSGASGYKLYVKVNGTEQTPISLDADAYEGYVCRDVANGSQYAFTVSAIAGESESERSAEVILAPVLANYVRNDVTGEISISVEPDNAMCDYAWYYDASTTSTSDYVLITGTTGASYTPSGAAFGRTIRVVATGATDSASAGSIAVLEITPPAPSVPTIAATYSYNDDTGVASVTVVSDGVDDAVSYRLDYSYTNGKESGTGFQEFSEREPINFVVPNALRGATYEFTLTALNDGGSTASNTSSVVVAPAKPTLTSTYANTPETGAVTFDVSAATVPGATNYTLNYKINNVPQTPLALGAIPYGETTTVSLPTDFVVQRGATYEMALVATNAGGSVSSNTITQTIAPEIPKLDLSYSYDSATDTVTALSVSGCKVSGATSYLLNYSIDGVAQLGISFNSDADLLLTLADTVRRGATYEFTLTATNGGGSATTSAISQVVIPKKPTLAASYSESDVAITVTGGKVHGAESYTLNYSHTLDGTTQNFVQNYTAEEVATADNIIFTIPKAELVPGATYAFTLTATNSSGSVSTSPASIELASLPNTPSGSGFIKEGTTLTMFGLSFSDVDNADGYSLYWEGEAPRTSALRALEGHWQEENIGDVNRLVKEGNSVRLQLTTGVLTRATITIQDGRIAFAPPEGEPEENGVAHYYFVGEFGKRYKIAVAAYNELGESAKSEYVEFAPITATISQTNNVVSVTSVQPTGAEVKYVWSYVDANGETQQLPSATGSSYTRNAEDGTVGRVVNLTVVGQGASLGTSVSKSFNPPPPSAPEPTATFYYNPSDIKQDSVVVSWEPAAGADSYEYSDWFYYAEQFQNKWRWREPTVQTLFTDVEANQLEFSLYQHYGAPTGNDVLLLANNRTLTLRATNTSGVSEDATLTIKYPEVPSLVVTTKEDKVDLYDGKISLREAVEIYSKYFADALGTTITFAEELNRDTIDLSAYQGGTYTLKFKDGDRVWDETVTLTAGALNLDHTLTITDESKSITLDANTASGVFNVTANATLNGLAFANGAGYAIKSTGDNLTILNASFTGNESSTDSAALHIERGALYVENVLFVNNASDGGASAILHSGGEGDSVALVNVTATKNDGASFMQIGENVTTNVYNSIIVDNTCATVFAGASANVANSVVSGLGTIAADFPDESVILNDVYRINTTGLTAAQRLTLIDAGDASKSSQDTDLANRQRVTGVGIDLGAYEVRAALTLSYSSGDASIGVSFTPCQGAQSYTVTFLRPGDTEATHLYTGESALTASMGYVVNKLVPGDYLVTLTVTYRDGTATETSDQLVAVDLAAPTNLAASWRQVQQDGQDTENGVVTLTWTPTPYASGYEIRSSIDGLTYSTWTLDGDQARAEWVAPEFVNGFEYAFTVVATYDDASGYSTVSAVSNTATLAPVKASAVVNSATGQFAAAVAPEGAQAEYAWRYIDADGVEQSVANATGANYTPSDDAVGRYVVAEATGVPGTASAGSKSRVVIAPPIPTTPALNLAYSYDPNTDVATITATSDGSDYATLYELAYTTGDGVTSRQTFERGRAISLTLSDEEGASAENRVIRGATYTFTLVARNDGDAEASATATVAVAPEKPQLKSTYSYDASTDQAALTVTANSVSGATEYLLQYSIDGIPQTPISYGADAQIALPNGFEVRRGSTYVFTLEAKNQGSVALSNTETIIVAPSIPKLTGAYDAKSVSIRLNRNSVRGATAYELKYKIAAGEEISVSLTDVAVFSIDKDALQRNATYEFWLVASNDGGSSSSDSVTITIEPVPSTPSIISAQYAGVLNATTGAIEVHWNPVDYADGYRLFVSENNGESTKIYEGAAPQFTASARNGSVYCFTVAAYSELGESGVSSPVIVAPLRAEAMEANNVISATVTPDVVEYDYEWRCVDGEESRVLYATGLSYTRNVEDGTLGRTVTLTIMGKGKSSGSSATFTFVPSAPDLPEFAATYIKENKSISVAWTPQDNVNAYSLSYTVGDSSEVHTAEISANGAYLLPNVSQGAKYGFTLTATNAGGSQSSMRLVTTPETTAPSLTSATYSGDPKESTGVVTLDWTAATYVDGYRVYSMVNGVAQTDAVYTGDSSTTTCEVQIENGKTYEFAVESYSEMNVARSNTITVKPLSITAEEKNGVITATIAPEEVDYTIAWSRLDDAESHALNASGLSYTRNASDGTLGHVVALTITGSGTSSGSNASFIFQPEAPATPEYTAEYVKSSKCIHITWTPQDNVNAYSLSYTVGDSSEVHTAEISTNGAYVLSDVSQGVRYNFTLTATNAGGSQSSMRSVTTPETTAPSSTSATYSGEPKELSGRVTLSWTSGDYVDGYRVYETIDGVEQGEAVYTGDSSTTTCEVQVENGKTYEFVVESYSEMNVARSDTITVKPIYITASEESGVITATVAPVDAEYDVAWSYLDGAVERPLTASGLRYERNAADGTLGRKVTLAVTGKGASAASNTSFTFTPSAPSTPTLSGGYDASSVSINLTRRTLPEATSYELKYTLNAGAEVSVPLTETDAFSIPSADLRRDATYKFWLIASNDGGNATSEPLTVQIEPVPTTPTISSAQYDGATNATMGEIKVVWNAVDYADGYRLFVSVGNGAPTQIYDGKVCEFAFGSPTAANGSSYAFTVVAYSELGDSEKSPSVVVAPLLAKASEQENVITATITPDIAEYECEWFCVDGDETRLLDASGLSYERNVEDGTLGRTVKLTVTGKGKSSGSSATFTFAPGAPSTPEFTAAYDKERKAISIAWIPQDNVNEYALTYQVNDSVENHPIEISTTGDCTLTDVQPGTAYSFTLMATNSNGSQTLTRSVTTPITAASTLSTEYSGNPEAASGTVTLSWSPVDYVDGYRAYAVVDGEKRTIYENTGLSATCEVQNGKTYEFFVVSYSELNEARSNSVTVKPLLITKSLDNHNLNVAIVPEDAEFTVMWNRIDGTESRPLDASDLSYTRNADDGTLDRIVTVEIMGVGSSSGSNASFTFVPDAPATPEFTAAYVKANKTISVAWTPQDNVSEYALTYTIGNSPEVHTAEISTSGAYDLQNVSSGTTYNFTLTATNAGGSQSSMRSVTTPETTASSLESATYSGDPKETTGVVTLAWTAATYVDGYRVYAMMNGVAQTDAVYTGDGSTTTCEVQIENGKTYEFVVESYSEMNVARSNAKTVKPLLIKAMEKKGEITATIEPIGAEYVVAWNRLNDAESHSLSVDGLSYVRNATDDTLGRTVTLTITGRGMSKDSNATFTFKPDAPSTPEFTATYVKASKCVSVTWTPQENVKEYALTYTVGDSSEAHTAVVSNVGAYELHDVSPNTTYRFALEATNDGGSLSSTRTVTTPCTKSATLTSAYSGDAQATTGVVTLNWTAVDYVDGYRVFATVNGAPQSELIYSGVGQTATYEVQNGKTYEFVVESYSELNAANSNAVAVIPLLATASEESGVVSATINPVGAEYDVAWSYLDGEVERPLTASGLRYERNVLDGTLGRKVKYTVTGKGDSAGSVTSFTFTPSAPSTPTLSGGYDAGLVSINLTRESLSEATAYELKYTINNGEEISVPLTETTAFSIPSDLLHRDATYKFWLIASNAGGSATSEPLTVQIEPVPTAPTISSAQYNGATNATTGEIKILWNAVDYADGYRLFVSVNNGALTKIYDGKACEFAFGTPLVANGSSYAFTVVAYSELGDSEKFSSVVVAPLLAKASEKENVITATITPDIAEYECAWFCVDGSETRPLNATDLSYERNAVDGTLGRTVTLTITGKGKSAGSGARFTFIPGAPSIPEFTAEYVKTSKCISAAWTPQENVNEYALTYTIGDSSEVHASVISSIGAYELTNVSPKTTYTFALLATNANGSQTSTRTVITPETMASVLTGVYSGDAQTPTGVITLNWTSAEYVDGYRVFATVNGEPQSEPIYSGLGQATAYELQNGKTYEFVVESYSELNTAISNVVTVKPLLATASEEGGVINATIKPDVAEYDVAWSYFDGEFERPLTTSGLRYERNAADGTLGRKVAFTVTGKGDSIGSSTKFTFTPNAPSRPTLTGAYDASSVSIILERNAISEATSYELKYKINAGEEVSVSLTDSDVFSISKDYLKRGATYVFWLVASNDGGSATSDPITIVIDPAPATPTIMSARYFGESNVTAGEIKIVWNSVACADGYRLYVSENNEKPTQIYEGDACDFTYGSTFVTNGSTYAFTVVAYSELGESNASSSVTVAPLQASASEKDNIITATITPDIAEYDCSWYCVDGSETRLLSATGLSYTRNVDDGTLGRTVTLAITGKGASAGSSATFVFAPSAPATPTFTTAYDKTTGSIYVAWIQQEDVNEYSLSYSVEKSTDVYTVDLSGNGSYQLTDVLPGTTYHFSLLAENASGTQTETRSVTTPITTSTVLESAYSGVAKETSGLVTLNWSEVEYVDGYRVYAKIDGVAQTEPIYVGLERTTTYVVQNGKSYDFVVETYSEINAARSNVITVKPLLTTAFEENGVINANVNPEDSEYEVVWKRAGDEEGWLDVSGLRYERNVEDGTLGRTITLTITGKGASVGSSATFTFTPDAPSIPDFSATYDKQSRAIVLSWTPQSNVNEYSLSYSVGNSVDVHTVDALGAGTYQLTNVAPGTTYRFTLEAMNANGSLASTHSVTTPVTEASTLEKALYSGAANASSGVVTLNWSSVEYVDEYGVFVSVDGNAPKEIYTGQAQTTTYSVQNGRSYEFFVETRSEINTTRSNSRAVKPILAQASEEDGTISATSLSPSGVNVGYRWSVIDDDGGVRQLAESGAYYTRNSFDGTLDHIVTLEVTGQGESAGSSSSFVFAPELPLSVDFDVVFDRDDGAIKLNWSVSPNVSGYSLMYTIGKSATVYQAINNELVDSFVLRNPAAGEEYRFTLTASNASGLLSAEKTITIPQLAPVTLTGAKYIAETNARKGAVRLMWTKSPYADGYRVYVAINGQVQSEPIYDGLKTIIAYAARNGKTYSFYVESYNEFGSVRSNTLTVKPFLVTGEEMDGVISVTSLTPRTADVEYSWEYVDSSGATRTIATNSPIFVRSQEAGSFGRSVALLVVGKGESGDAKSKLVFKPEAPNQPELVASYSRADNTVDLSWQNDRSALSYKLTYMIEGEEEVYAVPLEYSAVSYCLQNPEPGKNYVFSLVASNDGGESAAGFASVTVDVKEEPSTVVTTLDDVVDPYDGWISLREAVEIYSDPSYNGSAMTDVATITFDLAGYFADKGRPQVNRIELGELGQISITRSTTIDGGDLAIVVDANGNSRAFYAEGEFDASTGEKGGLIDVAILGLTITNGSTEGYNPDEVEGAYAKKFAQDGAAISAIAVNLRLKDAVLSNNVSSERGGAISVNGGSLDLENVEFTNNVAVAKSGGAAVVETAVSARLHNVRAIDNYSGKLGGAFYLSHVKTSITDSQFEDNVVAIGGGAFYIATSEVTVENVLFAKNESRGSTYGGGAIYARAQSTLNIADSSFIENVASRFNGGAIVLNADSTGTVLGGTFVDNSAYKHGGAIYANESTVSIRPTQTSASTLTNNSAGAYGGAIYAMNLDLERSVISNNSSLGGSGVAVTGTGVISNTLIVDNKGRHGLYAPGTACVDVVNSTIVNNQTSDVWTSSSSAHITFNNSIVAVNSPREIYTEPNTLSANNTLSTFTSWSNGSNNIVYEPVQPLFALDSYELSDDSTAIDRGSANYVDYSYVDLAGSSRIQGRAVDLGAYETEVSSERPSLIVTTVDDVVDPFDRVISLREATEVYLSVVSESANTTISFAPELNGKQIVLSGKEIAIRQSMTLDATSLPDGLVINANGASRAFSISDADASFMGLTISNGATTKQMGGAVYAVNSNVLFKNVALLNNTSGSSDGGALAISNGSVSLVGTQLIGNVARYGGAIFSDRSRVTTTNTDLIGNSGVTGGAVYLKQGDGEFVNTTFDSNVSTSTWYAGGAIYEEGANVVLKGSVFTGNQSTLSMGGALYLTNGSLSIVDTSFTANVATTQGGAIISRGTSLIEICDSSFIGNLASDGGALYLSESPTTITRTNFEENATTTGSLGGAIYFQSVSESRTLTVIDSNFRGNVSGRYGGAIATSVKTNLIISGGEFSSNSGTVGAVIYARESISRIEGALFIANEGVKNSGTLWFSGGAATLERLTFSGNQGGNVKKQSNAEVNELGTLLASNALLDDAFTEFDDDEFELEFEV